MWLLEQEGEVFEGRRLWLRPGKLYLFGRTSSEAGQLAISHKTISRRHMTIRVDSVKEGDGENISSRSEVTVEDLGTKIGTVVDQERIRGDKRVIAGQTVELKLGNCPDVFRLSWHPIVLSFTFTSRELQSDPLSKLRDRLEQLDIKFILDYNWEHTTHAVSKKRNTSKGLQALINGKYIVAESFVEAILVAAAAPETADATESSALEQDFDGSWPNALDYLPPRGGEPVDRPPTAYAPDTSRQDIFEGYTFIFYDSNQYDNLLAPITNGKGKALYTEVNPTQTSVDDFVLFVKTEAGEKGLGSFEDGSEGRGVVVVRFTPNKGDHIAWYADFFTQVSLRLDHRPIEQNEFLEAILINDASILRRPLEIATTQEGQSAAEASMPTRNSSAMEVDLPETSHKTSQHSSASVGPPARRGRARRAATRRFAGFDQDDSDDGVKESLTHDHPESAAPESQESLFVSQEPEPTPQEPTTDAVRSQRKRPTRQDDDIMDGMAPTAAAAKRRRIEAGEEPVPRRGTSVQADESASIQTPKIPQKKAKKEIDVLEAARKRREEVEAQAKAEQEDLVNLPSDVDLDAIRKLHIVEEMELRRPANGNNGRTREQDIVDGRWDPRWNGRKNFKKFQQRGATAGRGPMKVIVGLDEVKRRDFGIGDDYWLEDDSHQRKKGDSGSGAVVVEDNTPRSRPTNSQSRSMARPSSVQREKVVSDDDSRGGDVVEDTLLSEADGARAASSRSRTRGTTGATSQPLSGFTASSSGSRGHAQRQGSQAKRPATPLTEEPPAKKLRPTQRAIEVQDSDESGSEDELKFKFGRRR